MNVRFLGHFVGGHFRPSHGKVRVKEDPGNWNLPVVNKLLGVFDFTVSAGNGFVLPRSGEAFVTAVPEPSVALLIGLGLLPLAAWLRRRRPKDR